MKWERKQHMDATDRESVYRHLEPDTDTQGKQTAATLSLSLTPNGALTIYIGVGWFAYLNDGTDNMATYGLMPYLLLRKDVRWKAIEL